MRALLHPSMVFNENVDDARAIVRGSAVNKAPTPLVALVRVKARYQSTANRLDVVVADNRFKQ